MQLKALFDRPVGFRRDAVGGMGTGMCCLAARVKALGHGADCGARRRTDDVQGVDVWMRVPFEPPAGHLRALSGIDDVEQMSTLLDLSFGHHVSLLAANKSEIFAPDFDDPPAPATGPIAPAVADHTTTAEAPSNRSDKKDAATSSPSPLAGLRILVVDDSAPIRKVMQRNLKDAGAVVETAIDGQDAVKVVHDCVTAASSAARFDVIVTDIQVSGRLSLYLSSPFFTDIHKLTCHATHCNP